MIKEDLTDDYCDFGMTFEEIGQILQGESSTIKSVFEKIKKAEFVDDFMQEFIDRISYISSKSINEKQIQMLIDGLTCLEHEILNIDEKIRCKYILDKAASIDFDIEKEAVERALTQYNDNRGSWASFERCKFFNILAVLYIRGSRDKCISFGDIIIARVYQTLKTSLLYMSKYKDDRTFSEYMFLLAFNVGRAFGSIHELKYYTSEDFNELIVSRRGATNVEIKYKERRPYEKEATKIAKLAIQSECRLLHDQIGSLIKQSFYSDNDLITNKKVSSIIKKLPGARIFGTKGVEKELFACPCEKKATCLLVKHPSYINKIYNL